MCEAICQCIGFIVHEVGGEFSGCRGVICETYPIIDPSTIAKDAFHGKSI